MIDIHPYLMALMGGGLIGLAASGMLITNGRVMGVSGIIGGILKPEKENFAWRITFIMGVVLTSFLLQSYEILEFEPLSSRSNLFIAIGGLFVGFGTTLGNGCTSGHGICGISRYSMRSILATGLFILSGILATYIINKFILG